MNVVEELKKPKVWALREKHHELTGRWFGYHWEEYGSIEECVKKLKAKIVKADRELEKKQDHRRQN